MSRHFTWDDVQGNDMWARTSDLVFTADGSELPKEDGQKVKTSYKILFENRLRRIHAERDYGEVVQWFTADGVTVFIEDPFGDIPEE